MGPHSTYRPFRTRWWLPAVLCAVAAIAGCSDDPAIDPLALEGKWTFELAHFSGSGATCRSTPQTTWSNKYRDDPDFDGYQWTLIGAQFTCVLPGADTQHWTLRDSGFPSGTLAFLNIGVYKYHPPALTGCIMPTSPYALTNDSVRTRLFVTSCSAAPKIEGDELRATRSIQFRFPDTTGGTIYSLSGIAILHRR